MAYEPPRLGTGFGLSRDPKKSVLAEVGQEESNVFDRANCALFDFCLLTYVSLPFSPFMCEGEDDDLDVGRADRLSLPVRCAKACLSLLSRSATCRISMNSAGDQATKRQCSKVIRGLERMANQGGWEAGMSSRLSTAVASKICS